MNQSLLRDKNLIRIPSIKDFVNSFIQESDREISLKDITDVETESLLKEVYDNLEEPADKYSFIYAVLDQNTVLGNTDTTSFKDVIATSILEKGFDYDNNKFLQFASKVPGRVSRDSAVLIKNLLDNEDITLQDRWVLDPSFYKEKDSEVEYKLKAITFLNDESQVSRFMDPDSVSVNSIIYNEDNSLSTAKEVRAKLEAAQTRSGEGVKKGNAIMGKHFIREGSDTVRVEDLIRYITTELPEYKNFAKMLSTALEDKDFHAAVYALLDKRYNSKEEFDKVLSEYLADNLNF